MCVNFNCIFFRKSMQLDLNKSNKKTPFISGAFSNRMGRTMRIELTSVWFTARCVNHFTTFAKSQEIVYINISCL